MMRAYFLLCITGLLTGCQIGTHPLATNTPAPELSPAALNAIAGDMVMRLAEQVGSRSGAVVLTQGSVPFDLALAGALKSSGFEVATDGKADGRKDAILLSCTIDDYEGRTLVQLSTQNFAVARAYSTTAKGATPASPISVIRRG